jgi:hypothetical protein
MNSWKLIFYLLLVVQPWVNIVIWSCVLQLTFGGFYVARREPSLEVSSIRGASDTTQIPLPVLYELHFLLDQCKLLLVGC